MLAFGLLAAGAYGQQRMLEYVLPRGGSRGATVEVTLHGQYLGEPKQILFYDSGIKAVRVAPGAKPGNEVKAAFEIAPDCTLGEHVLRLRTATALSEPVTFWVSRFPTVYETETKPGENDTIEKAQPVPLNSTVEGQILPGAQMDKDVYRVNAKAGERLSVEIEAMRLGTTPQGGENDLMVRILDRDGKELARGEDSALYVQDPIASIFAPRTGAYYIEIQQQIYTPPRLAWYRAHIGSFLRPLGIYPAGGEAGHQITARIIGDPTGERTDTIALPMQTGNFAYYSGDMETDLRSVGGDRPEVRLHEPPSPNILRVSSYPNVLKAEGSEPTPVPSLPAALNGILTTRGQPDTFHFTAKKGQSWKVQVFARTLGSPMDPKIWIRANQPNPLLNADDCRLADLGFPSARASWYIKDTLDPVAVFRAPADGDYILGIEDTRGAAGPAYVYRIEIEPLRDAVYTHITTYNGWQIPRLVGLIVPRGNRWTLDVQLAPGFGNQYRGDIELEAAGLPRGIHMIAPRFTKGVTRLPVQFTADADAEPQAALVELLARPVDRKTPLDTGSRQGFALINRGNELPLHVVFLDKYALAVTQPAPFHIEMEAPAIPLVQAGELALKVKVIRDAGFTGVVEIQPDWLPPSVSKGAVVTIKPNESESVFKIQAGPKAAPGVYQIAMNASTTGGDAYSGIGRVRVSSGFVDLKVSESYLAVNLKRASIERGQRGTITATLDQKQPFSGEATIALQNLPRGVKMLEPAPRITSKDKEVVFQIEADPDTLAGLYKELTCEIALTENGQPVRVRSGFRRPARGPSARCHGVNGNRHAQFSHPCNVVIRKPPKEATDVSPRRKPWERAQDKSSPRRGRQIFGAARVLSPRSGASVWGVPTHGLRRGLTSAVPSGLNSEI